MARTELNRTELASTKMQDLRAAVEEPRPEPAHNVTPAKLNLGK